jgi:carboxylesterase
VPARAGNQAFELDGDGAVGVVLQHGFTGSPWEVRYLGERLAAAGISVVGPLLPGHGTRVEDLDAVTWQDWVAHVERAVDRVAERCDRVAIVGQSLGGLLALYVASRRPSLPSGSPPLRGNKAALTCVASLAAPLWLEGLSARVARWAASGKVPFKAIPKFGGSDVLDPRSRVENPCYPAIPMKALRQLVEFMRVVDASLARVTQPTLVLHARQDHTAPVACADRIAEATHAERVRILPRSYHLIAVDVERDVVAAEVIEFVRKHSRVEERGQQQCAT